MDKEYSPVLPFDCTVNDNFIVYDNVTYRCGIDQYQAERTVKMHHSTMIKYYQCAQEEKPRKLGGG